MTSFGNWVETRQNCLVLFCLQLFSHRGQDKTVLSRPCRRREQAITRYRRSSERVLEERSDDDDDESDGDKIDELARVR